MSTTTDTSLAAARGTTVRQRVGLALAAVFCLAQLLALMGPPPEGEVGPPLAILLADGVLAVVGLAAVAVAWRSGRRAALTVLAGCVVLILLTMLPAFFVPVPAVVKSVAAVAFVWGLVSVVLSLGGRPGAR